MVISMTLGVGRLILLAIIAVGSCVGAFAQPYGKIGEKYGRLGGVNGALGPHTGDEAPAPHGGRYQAFRHGYIYWHPEIDEAFGVWGSIKDKFVQSGGVGLGYPITDERATGDGRGRYNHFRAVHLPGKLEASIYWTSELGAFTIYGAIRDAWAKGGWERGPMGYPTSDEFQDAWARRQNFERGHILWTQKDGVRVVQSGAAIPKPSVPFGPQLVNGIEIAINNQVLASQATFLSDNTVCSGDNVRALAAKIKEQLLSQVNPRIGKYNVSIRHDVQLTLYCSFRASVGQTCGNTIALKLAMRKNLLKFWVDTVTTADPAFSIDFDVEAETTISLPQNSMGQIALGAATARILNIKFDSQNPAGDVVFGIAEAANAVSKFVGGPDFLSVLQQNRQFTFPGVEQKLADLHPAIKRIPTSYRIQSCMSDRGLLRLNGANIADQSPILR